MPINIFVFKIATLNNFISRAQATVCVCNKIETIQPTHNMSGKYYTLYYVLFVFFVGGVMPSVYTTYITHSTLLLLFSSTIRDINTCLWYARAKQGTRQYFHYPERYPIYLHTYSICRYICSVARTRLPHRVRCRLPICMPGST